MQGPIRDDMEVCFYPSPLRKCLQYLACVGLKVQGAIGRSYKAPRHPFDKYGWRVDKTIVLLDGGIFVAIIVVGELLATIGVV